MGFLSSLSFSFLSFLCFLNLSFSCLLGWLNSAKFLAEVYGKDFSLKVCKLHSCLRNEERVI